jgi:microcystin-dependent protein
MSDPYIGEIRIFGGNFAPQGWAFCYGQLMPIAENDALFTLIGTTYGGDGQSTFALPNLSGRVPIHQGQGPGLTNRIIGEASGSETVTLGTNQMPFHSHVTLAASAGGNQPGPGGGVWAAASSLNPYATVAADTNMNSSTIAPAGNSQPHENRMPYLAISFIISLFGIYPSQA